MSSRVPDPSARPSSPAAPAPRASGLPAPKVLVGICTYRRPALLAQALDAVAVAINNAEEPAAILVVDNDGSDAGVPAVIAAFESRTGVPTTCRVERKPGIAAARETVFRSAVSAGARWLAMVDDDELPSPAWLAALLAEQRRSGATVVGGPVTALFPPQAGHLQRYARFWSVERQTVDGRPFVYAAGNFLVDLDAISDENRPLFDDSFGLTGGEDVVFFKRLLKHGKSMSWCEDAVVRESVPMERASLAWIRWRRFGTGNGAVNWEREDGRLRALGKTLALTARLVIYPLLGREPEAPLVGWMLELNKVLGRYAAHCGYRLRQYRR